MKAAGKPSWKEAEKGLNKIADTQGRNRLAREIEAEEIVELIRPHISVELGQWPTMCGPIFMPRIAGE